MADYDSIDVAGGDVQCFRPGASNAASTTHDLTNVSIWAADADCTYSYDTGEFAAAINTKAGVPIRVPKDATTLTLSPSTAIAYMRKIKS